MATTSLTQQQVEQLIQAAIQAATNIFQQEINQVNALNQQGQADLAAAQADQVNAQQQIGQLQNVMAAIPAGPALPVPLPPIPPVMIPAVPPPVRFAYTPGTVGAEADLIDYSTTAAKINKAATDKLPVELDLDKEHLYEFLEALRSCAIACGWYYTLFMVSQSGVAMNLL
jgi:hypothetical protein